LSSLILEEINSLQRCGTDYKYNDLYLLIEQEIDKDYSVTQDSTDWIFVYKETLTLLENETKDLKLATWWLFASWKKNYWTSLEENFPIYIQLINEFNQDLYPKSQKAKTNILFWLDEALTKEIIYNDKINSLTKHLLFYELFTTFQETIEKSFEDNSKRFTKIINYLKPYHEREKQKLIQENIKTTDEKIHQENQEKTIKNEDAVFEILNDNQATKALSNLKKNAAMLSSYYRKKDFKDLKALRIAKFLSWFDVEGLPYADGKKAFLYPPSELEIDELNSLFRQEKYPEALCLAQEIIEVSPFWLDGHYFIYQIFEKTNNKIIANEAKNSLLSFLKTNDGVLDYYFQDNVPFASNRVKSWLKDELIDKQQIEDSGESNTFTNKIESIYELANNDKLKEAMQFISKEYEISSSIEEKFNWRLINAKLAVEFEKKDIALALIEDLQTDIEDFKLDIWNPKLASKVYTLILNSFSNVDITQEKLEIIYKKLCKTDIDSAFEIKIN
jgi:type VI secretion system protein VasJ